MRKSLMTFLLVLGMLLPGCNATPEGTIQQVTSEPTELAIITETPEIMDIPEVEWTPVYNTHRCIDPLPSMVQPKNRELEQYEIAQIVPGILRTGEPVTGRVYFCEDNTIHHVVVYIPNGDYSVPICLGEYLYSNGCCSSAYIIKGEKSHCAGVEYTLKKREGRVYSTLIAVGELNGVPIMVRMDTKDLDGGKLVFERILEAFACTKADTLTLSGIKPN